MKKSFCRILFLFFVGVAFSLNVFAEELINNNISSSSNINGAAKIEKNISVSGTNTVVKIKGNLIVKTGVFTITDAVVVIDGNLIVQDNGRISISSNANLLIDGNLTINSKSKLSITGDALVAVGNQIVGSGEIVLTANGNGNKSSMLSSFGGMASGANISFSTNFSGNTATIAPELFYIKDFSIPDGKKTVVDVSDETSGAYTHASEQFHKYAEFLPIELTYFTAIESNGEIVFDWQTASEVNNDFFTLEYSVNGFDFMELLMEDGSGTTSQTTNYSVSVSASEFEGITYFRLKQTDFNGEYSYSDVVVANVENNDEQLFVYPNPTIEKITVSGTFDNISICNSHRTIVLVQRENKNTFNVEALPKGTYYVIVETANGKKLLPFVKL